MKETTVKMPGMAIRAMQVVEVLVDNPGLRLVVGCLARFGLGILLAGAKVDNIILPLAVGLVAVGRSPLESLSALLGSSLGYLYLCTFEEAVLLIAAGVLVFATVCVLGGNFQRTWFMPCVSGVMFAMVGAVFLVQGQTSFGEVAIYGLQIVIAGISAYCFQLAYLRHNTWAIVASLGALVAGASGFTLFGVLSLGQLLAYSLVAGGLGIPGNLTLAAVLSLVLQWVFGGVSGPLLLCSTLVSPLSGKLPRPLVLLAFVAIVTLGALILGPGALSLVLVACVSSALALALPTQWYWKLGNGYGILAMEGKLTQMSQVLDQVGTILTQEADAPQPTGAADVFETASKEVCESCVLWSKCWRQRSGSTYQALCQVARPMMERGALLESDFPGEFLENCCNISQFVQSVNNQLDHSASRRQTYHRMTEIRQVLGSQYGFLAKYFQQVAQTPPPFTGGTPSFLPRLGVEMTSGSADNISGDKGAAFATDNGRYYVILCDGMGTGQGAAHEAQLAIHTMTGLLKSGLEPDKTLEILNGIYILRGNGAFSTVDLLAVDLVDGSGTLYKWGGAYSYIKGEETVRIGTAAPPPGLGVGASHKAQTIGLSLSRGEILILLTDGADHPKLGRQIESWKPCSPEELAKSVLAVGADQDGDDKTVVAVQLCPRIRH